MAGLVVIRASSTARDVVVAVLVAVGLIVASHLLAECLGPSLVGVAL